VEEHDQKSSNEKCDPNDLPDSYVLYQFRYLIWRVKDSLKKRIVLYFHLSYLFLRYWEYGFKNFLKANLLLILWLTCFIFGMIS
jgi:hypothetical protein